MKARKIIVVGGSTSAFVAAIRARLAHEQAKITVIDSGSLETSLEYKQSYNLDILSNTKAEQLDLDSRIITVSSLGKSHRLFFDALIFAPKHERAALEIGSAKRAAVIGAGFLGLKTAQALRASGLAVSVIEKKARIMSSFSLSFAEAMHAKLLEQGISLYLGTSLEQLDKSFDVVVNCLNHKPNISLLGEAGAALDQAGLIRVNEHMLSSLPDIYACGAAISVPHAVSHQQVWLTDPSVMQRTASIAGYNAALGGQFKDRLKPVAGVALCSVGNLSFARTGLVEHEARKLFGDEQVLVSTVLSEESTACVRLLVEKTKRRIIGAEVYGTREVERRIDLLSVAVLEEWSPDAMIDLDMASVSNHSPLLDPLKEAAMRAKLALVDHGPFMTVEKLALWLRTNQDFRLVDVGQMPLLSGRSHQRSLHVPLESLRDRLDELKLSNTPIVLYSKSGHRSYLAQLALRQRGMNNVYHLDGGIDTWNLVKAS